MCVSSVHVACVCVFWKMSTVNISCPPSQLTAFQSDVILRAYTFTSEIKSEHDFQELSLDVAVEHVFSGLNMCVCVCRSPHSPEL